MLRDHIRRFNNRQPFLSLPAVYFPLISHNLYFLVPFYFFKKIISAQITRLIERKIIDFALHKEQCITSLVGKIVQETSSLGPFDPLQGFVDLNSIACVSKIVVRRWAHGDMISPITIGSMALGPGTYTIAFH